jgi:hypothetical protein
VDERREETDCALSSRSLNEIEEGIKFVRVGVKEGTVLRVSPERRRPKTIQDSRG